MTPAHDLGRLYSLLERLAEATGQGRRLGDCVGGNGWPARGVYFIFEPGEHRSAAPSVARVVRVGTHAVGAGAKSSLWGRLRMHRGTKAGNGSHRSSIFRHHVGAAILRSEGRQLATWHDKKSPDEKALERAHEQAVSQRICAMSVLWVNVPDAPGPGSDRALIEKNAIALLSNGRKPMDPPSTGWLGRSSADARIAQSGLWNLNHVDGSYDAAFLDVLEQHVGATVEKYSKGGQVR